MSEVRNALSSQYAIPRRLQFLLLNSSIGGQVDAESRREHRESTGNLAVFKAPYVNLKFQERFRDHFCFKILTSILGCLRVQLARELGVPGT